MVLTVEFVGTVTNVRLVTDRVGTLIGSYRVPGSDDPSTPVFETGRSVLRLTSSETDNRVEGLVNFWPRTTSIHRVTKTIHKKLHCH